MDGGVGDELSRAEEHAQFCEANPASYGNRTEPPDAYNWCIVPESGADVIFFASLAVVVACLLRGKWSMLLTLIVGFALQGTLIAGDWAPYLSNSVAWWLGIEPYQLFFYVFLPPLILEAAVRINVFQFNKVLVQVLVLAFGVVIISTAALVPVLLYAFNLRGNGWQWQHVALFGAMVGPTDAVAILSVMKRFGGISKLRNILEGESLLNDASSITLFIVLLAQVADLEDSTSTDSVAQVLGTITWKMLVLALGGAALGLAFGMGMHLVMRWMVRSGVPRDVQLALTLAAGYLSFYVANSPCQVSGIICTAVFGLYGAATNKWDGGAVLDKGGCFDAFWDSLAFTANAIVFFFSGVTIANFTIRASKEVFEGDTGKVYLTTLLLVVPIWLTVFALRFVLLLAFKPLYWLAGTDVSLREAGFVTAAGIRGVATLIMGLGVVVELRADDNDTFVKAQMVLFSTLIVLLTNFVQSPTLPLVLRLLRLGILPKERLDMRRRAVIKLVRGTAGAVTALRTDKHEMLQGVDWNEVMSAVDVSNEYEEFLAPGERARRERDRSWAAALKRALGRLRRRPVAREGDGSGGGDCDREPGPTQPVDIASPTTARGAGSVSHSSAGGMSESMAPSSSLEAAAVVQEMQAAGVFGKTVKHAQVQRKARWKALQVPVLSHPSVPDLARYESGELAQGERLLKDPEGPSALLSPSQFMGLGGHLEAGSQSDDSEDELRTIGGRPSHDVPGGPPHLRGGSSDGAGRAAAAGLSSGARPPRGPGRAPNGAAGRENGLSAQAKRGSGWRRGGVKGGEEADEGGKNVPFADARDGPGDTAVLREVDVRDGNVDVEEVTGINETAKDAVGGPGLPDEVSLSQLCDLRVRLATGLKLRFHSKHVQGLLEGKGARLLNNACDVVIDAPGKPLRLWEDVLASQRMQLLLYRWLSRVVLLMRRMTLALNRQRHCGFLTRPLAWCLSNVARMLLQFLSIQFSRACEMAIQFQMALVHSRLVQWLYDSHASRTLLQEVKDEVQKVERYIIDRELEAPDRFQAIQTYRATLAVLQKQHMLVEQLWDMGMVDEAERDALLAPVDARKRRLTNRGPVVRAPTLKQVLRSLPFLRAAPRDLLQLLLASGALREAPPGSLVMGPNDTGAMWVVLSGLVKLSYSFNSRLPDQEYFLSSGAVFGLYSVLAARPLPGGGCAVAQRRATGQGAVLFCVPKSVFDKIEAMANAGPDGVGDPAAAQVHVDVYRSAALYAMERLKPYIILQLRALLQSKAQRVEDAAAVGSKGGAAPGPGSLPTPTPARGVSAEREAAARARLASLFGRLLEEEAPGAAAAAGTAEAGRDARGEVAPEREAAARARLAALFGSSDGGATAGGAVAGDGGGQGSAAAAAVETRRVEGAAAAVRKAHGAAAAAAAGMSGDAGMEGAAARGDRTIGDSAGHSAEPAGRSATDVLAAPAATPREEAAASEAGPTAGAAAGVAEEAVEHEGAARSAFDAKAVVGAVQAGGSPAGSGDSAADSAAAPHAAAPAPRLPQLPPAGGASSTPAAAEQPDAHGSSDAVAGSEVGAADGGGGEVAAAARPPLPPFAAPWAGGGGQAAGAPPTQLQRGCTELSAGADALDRTPPESPTPASDPPAAAVADADASAGADARVEVGVRGGGAAAGAGADRAAVLACRKKARQVYEQLRVHVLDAQLLDLAPGALYAQTTSIIVMRGGLTTTSPFSTAIRGPNVEHHADGSVTFQAPAVLPWVWDPEPEAPPSPAPADQAPPRAHPLDGGGGAAAAAAAAAAAPAFIQYQAHAEEGARLLVCVHDGGGEGGPGDSVRTLGLHTLYSIGKTLPQGQDMRDLLRRITMQPHTSSE